MKKNWWYNVSLLVCWMCCDLGLDRRAPPVLCFGFSIHARRYPSSIPSITEKYFSLASDAFSDTSSMRSSARRPNHLYMTLRQADFEYQEMKVMLDVLQREKIVSSNRMDPLKSQELKQYLERVVADRPSSSQALSEDQLRNTTWKLVYTTMTALPRDSTIQFTFLPEDNQIQYRLVFGSSTLGLNAINVRGDWSITRPNDIFMTYQGWTMDALGLENVHVCLLQNILKGRTNRIDTAYYDGTVWIERTDEDTPAERIWNVYIKEEDDDDASFL